MMSVPENKTAKEQRLRKLAVQLIAQLGNESADDMRAALKYAGDLVDYIEPTSSLPNSEPPVRLHSISRNTDKSVR